MWHTAHFIHSCVTAVVYDWLRYLSLTCIARVLGHSLRCAVSDGASDVSVLWLSLPRSLLTCRTAEPLEYHRSFLVSVENKFIQHLTDKCCSLDRYELLFVSRFSSERKLSAWWTRADRIQNHNTEHRWDFPTVCVRERSFCNLHRIFNCISMFRVNFHSRWLSPGEAWKHHNHMWN